MYCTECGTKLIEGAKFCSECGAPVKPIAPQPQKPFWQRAQEAEQKADETARAAEDKAEKAIEAAEEKAEEFVDAAEKKSEEIAETAEKKAEDAADAAEQKTDEAAEAAQDAEDEFDAEKAEMEAARAEAEAAIAAAKEKLDEVIKASKEPDYSKLDADELAKKYGDVQPEEALTEQKAEADTAEENKGSIKNAGEEAKKAAKAVAAGVGTAVENLQLSGMQKALMFLAGASFLCLVVSFTTNSWLMRALMILSSACLTFLAAKKHELPDQALVLPLTLTAIGIIGTRAYQILLSALKHTRITIGIDVALYRIVLIVSVVLLFMICFGQDKKSRIMLGITAVLSAAMAAFHLFNAVRYAGNGRATLMYNIGLMFFFAVYTLFAADYLKRLPAAAKAQDAPLSSTVDVYKKAEGAAERVYTTQEKEYKAMPYEAPSSAEDKGLQSVPGEYIFCTRCGTRLAKDAAFCSKCGYPVSNPMIPQNNQ